jgi:hypothetical protein
VGLEAKSAVDDEAAVKRAELLAVLLDKVLLAISSAGEALPECTKELESILESVIEGKPGLLEQQLKSSEVSGSCALASQIGATLLSLTKFLDVVSDQPYIDFSNWLDGQWNADKLEFDKSEIPLSGFKAYSLLLALVPLPLRLSVVCHLVCPMRLMNLLPVLIYFESCFVTDSQFPG